MPDRRTCAEPVVRHGISRNPGRRREWQTCPVEPTEKPPNLIPTHVSLRPYHALSGIHIPILRRPTSNRGVPCSTLWRHKPTRLHIAVYTTLSRSVSGHAVCTTVFLVSSSAMFQWQWATKSYGGDQDQPSQHQSMLPENLE